MRHESLPTPENLQQLWRFPSTYGRLSDKQQLVAAGDRILGLAGSTIFSIDIFRGQQPLPDSKGIKPGFPYRLRKKYAGDPCLTAAGGNVYFMDGNELVALRLSDGLPMLTRDEKDKLVPWTPPELENVNALVAVDGRVIALHLGENGNASVTGFSSVNGTKAFGPIDISDLTPGDIAYGDGAVFFVSDDVLQAVNVDFGDKRFERTEGGRTTEPLLSSITPCVAGDVVVAAGKALHFFDTKTGVETFEPISSTSQNASWKTPVYVLKANLIVASNTDEVIAVRSTDGKVMWRTKLDGAGQPTLLRRDALVTTEGGAMLLSLDIETGTVNRRFKLPQATAHISPIVNNDTVFIPDSLGSIEARPFGRQHAAQFNGRTSRIDIKAENDLFDFGTSDFTVEAWVRSSEGGEIISSFPTIEDAEAHGFRLNIGPNGELRVAIVNAVSHSLHAGRTRETRANDGEWHHVALVRRSGSLLALLDGKSLDLFFRDDSAAGLSIGGRSALTVGACVPAPGQSAGDHLEGLIREVRIWDRALDVATIQNNRHVQLTGAEPRLKGLWSLTEVYDTGSKPIPTNSVPHHNVQATFVDGASSPTDLSLDRSGFPYLLHETETHWPYSGTWAARGQSAVATPAALAGNALTFATESAIYGVRRADGRRLWQIDVARGTSAPISDGSRFLALTGDEGLIAIEPGTGNYKRLEPFAGLVKTSDTHLPAPVANGQYVVAAGQSGTLRIADRTDMTGTTHDVKLPSPVREVLLGATTLFASCDGDEALKIARVDLRDRTTTLLRTTSTVFAADRDWLFCLRSGFVSRIDVDGTEIKTGDPLQGCVTGMTTNRDADLLVVTSNSGWVFALSMSSLAERWRVKLCDGRVNPPTFDAAGRIFCTTATGIVSALDSASGSTLGLYRTPQSVTTPATVESATAYFGCADAVSPEAFRDGALHSVVMGETTVLRLGLDPSGSPSMEIPHVLVDIPKVDAAKHTLQLMDPTQSCVETWINIPPSRANSARRPGGGLFGLCPTQLGGFDINVSIDEDGLLHYSSRTRDGDNWSMFRASAATNLTDGEWHHLALSRDRADHISIYIDGQPLSDITTESTPTPSPDCVTGMKAYIGAMAGDKFEAVSPMCGMIAELRIWDTYMQPQEIAARMHVKLRGSEPDLLAYWNFDRQNLEDAGPDHHDGVLLRAGKQPVWWLTDLAFEKPLYPYITTSGSVLPHPAGQPPVYEITFAVHRADGSALPNHPLDLWYVRRRDDEPVDTLIDGSRVEGVTKGTSRVPYSVVTGSEGTVSVVISPTNPDHVPSIDVRAGFMASNERFHVNVLLDKQAHFVPVPPTLGAQSRLIQDYAYSSGGSINENRDRSTWRTVIKSLNPDGSPRAHEPISLWASEQLQVEVGGRTYLLNRENSAELMTDGEGEVVIVFDAAGLNATSLMARAAFMHRDDRLTIAPDQDLHRQLNSVQGSDFTQKRPTRWKPGMDEKDGEPLLGGDLAQHAEKVAEAITTVMASAKPADANPPPAPRGRVQLQRRGRRFKSDQLLRSPFFGSLAPMRQPVSGTAVDTVVMFRSRTNGPTIAPFTPERTRAALNGKAGFVFDTTGGGLRFDVLATRDQADIERGIPTREPIVLHGFFDDLWDTVVDVATDIYDGAVKVVVTVAETVEVAIHKMVDGITKIVHVVVDSIVEAANAVANFFEQIGVAIMKAIEFLRTLFNWKAILLTKDIIQEIFVDSIEHAKRTITKEKLERALLPLIGVSEMKPTNGPSISAEGSSGGEARSAALDEARGVQGQMVMQKSRDGITQAASSSEAPKHADAGSDLFTDLMKQIPLIVPQLAEMSPADVMKKLLDLAKQGFDASIRLFIKELVEISGAAFEILDWGMKLLRARINIPFISELYEWITGSPLTLLDVICLAIAVPVHVAHIAITTVRGNTRTFAEDNAQLAAQTRSAASGKLQMPEPLKSTSGKDETPQPTPRPMEKQWETLIIVLRGINIAAGLASDGLFAREISAGGFGAASQVSARIRGLAKVVKGGTGIAASYLMTYKSAPAFEARLKSGLKPSDWDNIKPIPWMNEAIFGVLVAGDAITFLGGIKQVLCPPLPATPIDDVIPADSIDAAEFQVSKAMFVGCIGLVGARIYVMQTTVDKLEQAKADSKLIEQARFFAVRDLYTIFSRMPWFMFTQTGATKMIKAFPGGAPTIYWTVTGARAVFQTLALGSHVIAVEVFGE